eukprot:220217_1
MAAPNVVCANCNKSNPSKRCGGCKVTKYCSKTCQTTHWKSSHQKNCKKLRQIENTNDDNKDFKFFRHNGTKCNENADDNIIGQCDHLKRLSYAVKIYKNN